MADNLLSNYQHVIEELVLVTSTGGAFEVTVNSDLIFSKKNKQKRHAEPGEILRLFSEIIGPGVPRYSETK